MRKQNSRFINKRSDSSANECPVPEVIIEKNRVFIIWVAIFLLTTLVLITFWKSFNNDFVDWDDYGYVINNNLVRDVRTTSITDVFRQPVASNYHPLTILSLRLNSNICPSCAEGISAAPFIKWNVFIHLLNTILVFLFIFLINDRNITIAFLVAALFGIHPMHVESVVWVSGRKDVLYTFFFLSGLIMYVKYLNNGKVYESRHKKNIWLVLTFLLFILACLSKAVAVVFPVILILISFWMHKASGDKPIIESIKNALSFKRLIPLIPFFIVSIFFGLVAVQIQKGENFLGIFNIKNNSFSEISTFSDFSFLQRIHFACYGFIEYIIKFFVPVNLSALYPYPTFQEFKEGTFSIIFWLSMAGTSLIIYMVLISLWKTKLYAFSIGFYLITILLVLQFIPVGMALMAERYSYMPYIGLSIMPATLIARSLKMKKILLLVISGCFIIMLMILSVQQIKVWNNSETLWSNVIDKHPHLEYSRRARGKFYSRKSSQVKSESEKKTLEDKAFNDFMEAIKTGTKSADVYEGTGIIFESRGEIGNAMLFFNKAILIDPKKGSAYYNRAMLYDILNQKEEAIKNYCIALNYEPKLASKIISNRSELFLETGKFREAKNDLDYLITLDNKNFTYYCNRAYSKLQLKDNAGAIDDYRAALKLKPDDELTRKRLKLLIETQTQ
jgi:protein O-mannosyl-transferase